MHPWKTVLIIQICFVLILSAAARAAALNSSEEERRFLQSEITLAQKTQIYFLLHLKEKKIYFKARGVVLRDMHIKNIRFWGRPENVKLYTMTGKAASDEPVREEIVVENTKQDEKATAPATQTPVTPPATPAQVDVKALELEDMPSSYKIMLDDGLVISVKPDSQGVLSGISSIARSLSWYISQPIFTVWYAIKSRPYAALNLVLNDKDAKALYWSIHEGNGVIIYNPQNH